MIEIQRTSVLEQVSLGEFHKIETRFKRIVKNTKRFNGRNITSKITKLGNGKKFEVFYNGNLTREISLLADRYCWELSLIDYKGGRDD